MPSRSWSLALLPVFALGLVPMSGASGASKVEVGAPLPAHRLTRLDGARRDPSTLDGRYLLLIFTSTRSKKTGIRWYEERAADFIGRDNLRVFCVVTPPPAVRVVSRASVTRRLEEGVEKVTRSVREGLDASEQAKLDRLEVDWFMDWKGETAAFYGVDPDRLTLFLRDPEGRLVRRFEGVDGATVNQILRELSRGSATEEGGDSDRISTLVDRIRAKRGQVE